MTAPLARPSRSRGTITRTLRRTLTSVCCATALAAPASNALALTRAARTTTKKIVSTETVTGPVVKCYAWGFMQVQLKVIKTVITNGSKTTVAIKIASVNNVSWPIYPNHTPRSIYINAQALPLLQQETFQLQANAGKDLQIISGASNTTASWQTSLQGALLRAEKP